ncbi:MAG: YfhO family protein [Pirellulales bacterium]
MKRRLTVFVGTGVLLAWFFAPAVSGTSSFTFRDAAHYYHPLFEYVRGEWLAGRPPLWNPYENIGAPLVAENTSSLFYPGKLLFALPLDDTLLYNLYIVLHVALAAATSYGLARDLRASRGAAALAAVSYAFSGPVLSQYSNVVFLVGAAWLPLAVWLANRMLRRRSASSAAGFGAVLAMMILGGDPQMAYNAVLLAVLLALLLWRDEKQSAPPAEDRAMKRLPRPRAALLGISLIVAGLLAAVQILPTLEAAPHSKRAKYDAPRNIYELAWAADAPLPGDEQPAWYDGLLGRVPDAYQRQVYQFSVAPWRVVELVWPNVSGQAFPTNRRWLAPLGVERDAWDLWAPTLYMGLLPLVLAAAAWNVRSGTPVDVRFLSWMVVFGGAASLGVYGIAWAAGQVFPGADLGGIGGEVGGLYWWLTILLPKYIYFRYPAKLFVVASLGLSMLAGRGWDEAWQTNSLRVRRWFVVLFVLSLLGLVAAALGWSYIEHYAKDAPPAPILGPFNWAGAHRDLVSALVQTAALSVVFLAALAIASARPQWAECTRLAAFAVTVLDLAVAQEYLVLYAPSESWRTAPKVLDRLPKGSAGYRVFRQLGLLAPSWERSFSQDRFAECVRWDRETLWPKYPLPYRVSLVEASETIAPDDYLVLLDVARGRNARAHKTPLPDPSILDLLAARVAIVGRDARAQIPSAESFAEGMFVGVRPQALERAWIVHQVEVRPKFDSRSPSRLRKLTEQVLFPDGKPRDWRRTAVVETDEPVALEPPARDLSADESCTIVHADPLGVEIEAILAADGLVVLADLYYPGWDLTVRSDGLARGVTILRTNRVMRGAMLPAGRHHLVYRYRPRSVIYGAAISGLSAMLLAAAAIYLGVRSRGV